MFILSTCQIGAEKVLRNEFALKFPQLRFSYSRPGFLTFKLDEEPEKPTALAAIIQENSVFARRTSVFVGKIKDQTLAETFWKTVVENQIVPIAKLRRIHTFSRDTQPVGDNGFEPLATENDKTVFKTLMVSAPNTFRNGMGADRFAFPSQIGERVLDCVEVEPNEFWIGVHETSRHGTHDSYPGCVLPIPIPSDMVSRAYLKFEEAIRRSGFKIGCGTRCVDIGSAPGGASQALLARGAEVLGVDPAEMDERVSLYPNFTHIRGKIGQVRRKLFRKCKFAVCDMNVAPSFTLDVLDELVNHRETQLKGLIFTLKLFQWSLAEQIPEFVTRIKSWGFKKVGIRQLPFNRQELTVIVENG